MILISIIVTLILIVYISFSLKINFQNLMLKETLIFLFLVSINLYFSVKLIQKDFFIILYFIFFNFFFKNDLRICAINIYFFFYKKKYPMYKITNYFNTKITMFCCSISINLKIDLLFVIKLFKFSGYFIIFIIYFFSKPLCVFSFFLFNFYNYCTEKMLHSYNFLVIKKHYRHEIILTNQGESKVRIYQDYLSFEESDIVLEQPFAGVDYEFID